MERGARIFVAGHRGMVGSAIVRALQAGGYQDLILVTRSQLDLTEQSSVRAFFQAERPDYVFLAAAKVGGIYANDAYPADFIYDNLIIEANIIAAAYHCAVKRLLFLGSSCIYPKFAEQPISERSLLTGELEATNEPYAIAKIAGIKLCESFNRQHGTDFRSVMPTNLYGEGDNFHPLNSHVVPALIQRFHEAKTAHQSEVVVWGTGNARREFLHVDDMAGACVHVMRLEKQRYESATRPNNSHINVGTGEDVTIRDLAELVKKVVDFQGVLKFDTSKPDGTPRKLLDVSVLDGLGWSAKIGLEEGLKRTYAWYCEQKA